MKIVRTIFWGQAVIAWAICAWKMWPTTLESLPMLVELSLCLTAGMMAAKCAEVWLEE